MDWATFWKIAVSAIGFGAGGELIRRYRAFKHTRRTLPVYQRNAGFWTDARLYHTEALFSACFLALPFCVIIPLVAADRDDFWLYTYPALLVYALGVYLLIRGMNVGKPQ